MKPRACTGGRAAARAQCTQPVAAEARDAREERVEEVERWLTGARRPTRYRLSNYRIGSLCEQRHARGRIEAGRHRRNELNEIESVDE